MYEGSCEAFRPGPGKAKAWKTVRKLPQSTIELLLSSIYIGIYVLTFKSQF